MNWSQKFKDAVRSAPWEQGAAARFLDAVAALGEAYRSWRASLVGYRVGKLRGPTRCGTAADGPRRAGAPRGARAMTFTEAFIRLAIWRWFFGASFPPPETLTEETLHWVTHSILLNDHVWRDRKRLRWS